MNKYKNIKINFLILAITVLICLFLMEFVLRLVRPIPSVGVGTIRTEKARIYGWASVPNSTLEFINPDTDKIFYFTTNSQGWKDVEHKFDKPEGVIRILFLGDSFTWASVMTEDSYTRETEYLLKNLGFPNVETISIAIGGWGSDQVLEALQVEGIKYEPDFVVYQFCENDILENLMPLETTEPISPQWKKPFRYKLEDGVLKKVKLIPQSKALSMLMKIKLALCNTLFYNLKTVVNHIDIVKSIRFKWFWMTHPINPLTTLFRHSSIKQAQQLQEGWKLTEALIVKMKQFCKKNKVKFIVFTESGEEGVRNFYLKHNIIKEGESSDFVIWQGKEYSLDLQRPLKNLRQICKKNKIPLIEPKREYERYHYNPHTNKTGNMRMAEDIVDFLLHLKPFNTR